MSKKEEGKPRCYKLPTEGKTADKIALERCDCLIEQYLDWKHKNYRRSILAQGVALVCTAVIPVILLLPLTSVKIVGAALSALAAIATGFLAISGWRENFIRYGYIFHMLQVEKFLYIAHASKDYSDSQEATKNFVKRIEALVMLDVNEWRTEMQRLQVPNQ
jgi:hypothetical protein